jgi:hypothetical protein
VRKKSPKSRKERAPRIRVPNAERGLFQVDEARFVGVLQRLSLTGGSAVLSKGPIAAGTIGSLTLKTVYGNVNAQIEFLQAGADGVPLAQAFRFLAMSQACTERFTAAAQRMHDEGFSDAPLSGKSGLAAPASEALGKLLQSVRRIAATLVASRSTE